MDQLKALFRAAAKHFFWIGCGLILAVSVASWILARGNLQEEFEANLQQINSKDSAVSSLLSTQNPPNEHSHEKMEQLNANALKRVVAAWQLQYSHQEGILVWPRELKKDFENAVSDLKPIELKVEFNPEADPPTPINQELPIDLRSRYANYVEWLLPRLAELVGTKWQVGGAAVAAAQRAAAEARKKPAGMLPGTPQPQEEMPLVQWDESDQGRLLSTHFDWSSQPDNAPTTLQVLYAQEDLWVLEALVRIIARTNEGAESRHDAVVKSITALGIGRGVSGRSGQVTRLDGSTGGYGGDYYGEEEYGEEEYSGEEYGSEEGYGDEEYGEDSYGAPAGPVDPAQYRYVDNDYTPLAGERVRTALRSGSPEDAFLVVAKRMPIRMQLIVDRRKLPQLLVECGNSPLPVEVRQVRVNRQGAAIGGGYGGYGGYGGDSGGEESYGDEYGGGYGMGSGMGYGGEYGSEDSDYESDYGEDEYGGGYGFGYGGGSARDRTEVSSVTSHDVPVEIYGIIYIYNPVDEEKLGMQDPAS